MSAKIHEEDYRRETQINVPNLGPEILAVFANSQIFQDHQPTKLNRISTKTYLAGIHSPNREMPTTPRLSDQDRLLRRLEGDATDARTGSTEKRITFTLAPSSAECSPSGSQTTLTPKKFEAIAEEEKEDDKADEEEEIMEEVVLRPRLIDRHPHLLANPSGLTTTPKRILRSAKSVPHMNVRSSASETDIFSISGTMTGSSQISMTPEVPSISFSNLPKNYEDTPTIEKYRVSQSLYSIQTANAARATQDDYSMPRYFRRSAMLLTQSSEVLPGAKKWPPCRHRWPRPQPRPGPPRTNCDGQRRRRANDSRCCVAIYRPNLFIPCPSNEIATRASRLTSRTADKHIYLLITLSMFLMF
uniref:Uncharacterized protein anon-29Da n=1 Tax=Drosophila melanogaster TaxID=7227 RepID=Q9U5W3_DROME|nr:hypothetical protein [Drosophila melanogaster]